MAQSNKKYRLLKNEIKISEFRNIAPSYGGQLLRLTIGTFWIAISLCLAHSVYASIENNGQTGGQKYLGESRSVVLGSVRSAEGVERVNADITLTNTDDGKEIRTTTSQSDTFIFQSVRPGNYEMTVTAPGYRKTKINRIEVLAGHEAWVDLALMKDSADHVVTGEGEVLQNGSPVAPRSGGQIRNSDKTNDQCEDSAIHGVALDPMGAAIGRAAVTLTNTNSHSRQTALTDEQGMFGFRSIASGKYRLTVVSPGFYDFTIENVNLRNSEQRRVIATMQVDERIGGMEVSGGVEVVSVDTNFSPPPKPVSPTVETGITPLMKAVAQNDLGSVKTILNDGAQVDAVSNFGSTALLKIGAKTSPEVVTELLMAGADVNHEDRDDNTTLLIAARVCGADVVRILLNVGAHRNFPDKTGNTALIYAVLHIRIDTVKVLIAAGANLSTRNSQGLSALKCAINNNSEEIVKLLKASGAVE
jgi:hypothetical protein